MNGIEQHLVIERFGEKLGGAGLHRAHGHRNVAMPADEDDRKSDPRFRELLLKRESTHAGQPNVQHEATRRLRALGVHEFLR